MSLTRRRHTCLQASAELPLSAPRPRPAPRFCPVPCSWHLFPSASRSGMLPYYRAALGPSAALTWHFQLARYRMVALPPSGGPGLSYQQQQHPRLVWRLLFASISLGQSVDFAAASGVWNTEVVVTLTVAVPARSTPPRTMLPADRRPQLLAEAPRRLGSGQNPLYPAEYRNASLRC